MADEDDLAATMACGLPGDVMIDILTRLPIKSLVRFKCVSKSWNNLVRHPTFISMHYQQSESPESVLVIRRRDNFPGVSKLFTVFPTNYEVIEGSYKIPYPGSFRITGCCNGLLCLVSDDEHFNTNIFLYNPAIREFLPLLESRFSRIEGNNRLGFLAVGFGHDAISNDYKVVKIELYDAPGKTPPYFFHTEVYTLSTDFWKEIEYNMEVTTRERVSMAFVKGMLYWTALKYGNIGNNTEGEKVILTFDVANEVFGSQMLPEIDPNPAEVGWQAQVWKNHLTVIFYYKQDGNVRFDFWIWCNHVPGVSGYWNKQMMVRPYDGFNFFVGSAKNFDFFFYNTRIQGLSVVKHPNGEVVNLRLYSGFGLLDLVNYKESLVTVKGRNYVKRDIVEKPSWKDHILLLGGVTFVVWLTGNILSTKDGFCFLLEIVIGKCLDIIHNIVAA